MAKKLTLTKVSIPKKKLVLTKKSVPRKNKGAKYA